MIKIITKMILIKVIMTRKTAMDKEIAKIKNVK